MRPIYLTGQERPLTWITFNRDGDLLFTCSKDGRLNCHVTATGDRVGTYHQKEMDTNISPAVMGCDVNYDTSLLLAASSDMAVFLFNVETGVIDTKIDEDGPAKFVEWCRHPRQDKFVVATKDFVNNKAALCIYQKRDGTWKRILRITDFSSEPTKIHWGAFDATLISAHADGYLRVWDSSTGRKVAEWQGHTLPIGKLWNMTNYSLVAEYKADRGLNACAISPLISQYDQKFIANQTTRALMNEEPGLAMPMRKHIALGGGQEASTVTTTREGMFEVMLWHIALREKVGDIKGHFGPVNCCQFFPDGTGIASGGEEGFVRVWKFDDDYFGEQYD